MAGGILIVDDDEGIIESLSDALADEGCDVAVARDGLEALERLRGGLRPCVILLDWMMPRCDGATFRQHQKADPALARIPVVLLTADARVVAKREDVGAVAHLRKPIALEKLLAVIAEHCPDEC